MLVSEYRKFIRQLARELRNKSAEDQKRTFDALIGDLKREIRNGEALKK